MADAADALIRRLQAVGQRLAACPAAAADLAPAVAALERALPAPAASEGPPKRPRLDPAPEEHPWVDSLGGDGSVVLLCPHGGDLQPGEVPDRVEGCMEPDHDTATLAAELRRALQAVTGRTPALVTLRLHRRKLDGNRPRAAAAPADSAALGAWDSMHSAVQGHIREAVRRHGYCHLLDIHGQCHRGQTELGYLLRNADLREAAAGGAAEQCPLRRSCLHRLADYHHRVVGKRPTAAELTQGPWSLGGALERAGYPCVPSCSMPHPCMCEGAPASCWQRAVEAGAPMRPGGGGDCMYFWGACNVAMYGGTPDRPGAVQGLGCVSAAQVETSEAARSCPLFPVALALAVRDFMGHWYREEHSAVQFKWRPAHGPGARFGVGVAVFVLSARHPGCVLLSQRKGPAGGGEWALPGGHLDFGETLSQCAARETLEETGLHITRCRTAAVVNARDPAAVMHYLTVFVVGEAQGAAEPANLEPEKHGDWEWKEWASSDFRLKLFLATQELRDKGFSPFDAPRSVWGDCVR
eukprot:TRINITY_DN48054_c0_g1_i1.p1 TRINITY_DN48054_c0_g1~~TRINITY_DN48054_c0_g1_i1.p1  ORF type:complete len:525 (+),score=120.47 TRINITY_DN48054_c0_g1_i1:74-1648(+)